MIPASNKLCYQFASLHSFIMGLLPFFIPVILWQQGYLLWQLSLFIATTGLGFLLALPVWQSLYSAGRWFLIISLSFIFAALLIPLTLSYFDEVFPVLDMLILGLINGAYLCFYWTTQRSLFTKISSQGETSDNGKNFGNFQIVIMIFLKLGILVSAYFLEAGKDEILLLLGVILALSSVAVLYFTLKDSHLNSQIENGLQNTSTRIEQPSKTQSIDLSTSFVFMLDGIFLYLESYFWLLSLYIIAQQDVMQLGVLVVSLTALLAVIFWKLKSKIDALPVNLVFQIAIIGYGVSWILRSVLASEDTLSAISQYPVILLVAFLTTFFRLSFNKRFFDHAQLRKKNTHSVINYLLHKSYLSQFGIFVFFLVLGLTLIAYENILHIEFSSNQALSIVYSIAAPLVVLYGFYASPSFRFNKVDHHA